MNRKIVALFFVAVTAVVFAVTRFKTAPPSDLRDAVNPGSTDDAKPDVNALDTRPEALEKVEERYKNHNKEVARFRLDMYPDEAEALIKCVEDVRNPTVFNQKAVAECDSLFMRKVADISDTVGYAAYFLHEAGINSRHEEIKYSEELGKLLKGPVRLAVFQFLTVGEMEYVPGAVKSFRELDVKVVDDSDEFTDHIKTVRYQHKTSREWQLLGDERDIYTITRTSTRSDYLRTINGDGRYMPQHVNIKEYSIEQVTEASPCSHTYRYELSHMRDKPSEILVKLEAGKIVSAEAKNIEGILKFAKGKY